MDKKTADEETVKKAQEEFVKLTKEYANKEWELFEDEKRRGLHPPNVLDGPVSEETMSLHREYEQKVKELQLKYLGYTTLK